MKNNVNFVLQLERNGKFLAMALAIPKNENLYHKFDGYNVQGQRVRVVHYCDTRKEALDLEKVWNDGFKANGNGWDYSR